MWFLSGIYRDVYIYGEEKLCIRDIFANASLDESYTNGTLGLEVTLDNYAAPAECTVEASLCVGGKMKKSARRK